MTISDRIKSAEASREEAFRNNSISGVSYWDGYIDALKADENEKRYPDLFERRIIDDDGTVSELVQKSEDTE